MTESMGYLHEFENQRLKKQDSIGIEIELAPTIDMVRQKRTATTTRSIKSRQRSTTLNDTTGISQSKILLFIRKEKNRNISNLRFFACQFSF